MSGDRFSNLQPTANVYLIAEAGDLPQQLDQFRLYHLLYDPGAGAGMYFSPDGISLVRLASGGATLPAGTVDNSIIRWDSGGAVWLEFSLFIFPLADGAADQIMQTDGAGVVTWIDIPAGVDPGTVVSSTLRWDGADWVENVDFRSLADLIFSGTVAGDILNIQGRSGSPDTGRVEFGSPIESNYDTFSNTTPAEQYAFRWRPTFTASLAYVGGFLNVAPTVTISTGVFIPATFSDGSNMLTALAPGFSAFTFINELAIIENLGNFNLMSALIINVGLVHERNTAGTSTTPGITGMSFSPQTRATISGGVMTKTAQTAVQCFPSFSTVAGSTVNLGTIRGLHMQNPAVALFQPQAGTESATAIYGLDVNAMPFGGTAVPKAAVRSFLTAGLDQYFLLNMGNALSDFRNSYIHFNNNFGIQWGTGADIIEDYANGQDALQWNPVFGAGGESLYLHPSGNDTWIFRQDTGGGGDIGIGFDVDAISFGPADPTPNDNNWFLIFNAPNLRSPAVPGEYSDVLFSAAGSLDIDGLAMSEVAAFKINSLGILLNGGTIDDLANVRIEGMASFGATLVHSLQMTGRFTLDGAISYGSESPAQLLGNTNDWSLAPNNAMRTIVLLDSDGAYNVTGIVSSFGFAQDGDQRTIINTSAFIMTFTNEDVLSVAANRFQNANSGPITIAPQGSVTYRYEGGVSRWQQLYLTGTYLEEADADLLYLRLDTTNDPLTNNLDGVSFNSVVLTAAGAATNFLDETGAYSVPIGTPIPGTVTGSMLAYDGAAYAEETTLTYLLNVDITGSGTFGNELQIANSLQDNMGITFQGPVSNAHIWYDESTDELFEQAQNHRLISNSVRVDNSLRIGAVGDDLQITTGGGGAAMRLITNTGANRDLEVIAANGARDLHLSFGTGLLISEKGSAHSQLAGEGQWWTRNDVPNVPMFTDDAGVDHNLLETQGGSSIIAAYRFDTSIVEADPGAGDLRYDNATPASVTELFISATTDNGVDLQNILSFIANGDRIYVQQDNDSSKYILFDVTANVDNTGWFSIAGTVSNSGTIPDSNAKIHILILFGGAASGGQVDSVVGGTNITVDAGDPVNPIVNLDAALIGVSVNGVTLTTAGAATNYLDETGAYSVPVGSVSNIDDGTADGQIPIWDETTDTQWEPSTQLVITELAASGGSVLFSGAAGANPFMTWAATDGGLVAIEENTLRLSEKAAGGIGSADLAFFSSGGARAIIRNTHLNVFHFTQESSGITQALFDYPVAIGASSFPTVTVDGAQFFATLSSTPMVRQQQDFSYPVADVSGACYRFNNPTAAADPGATFMRVNNVVFASATELYFDDEDASATSQDMGFWFGLLAVGDMLRIHGVGEPDRWLQCTVDSITDNTGWWTLEITPIDSLGTVFVNGQDVQIQVQKAGVGGGITATPTPASGEVTVWDSTGATVTGFPALTFDGTELSSPELTATGNGVGSGAALQVKGTTSVGIYLEGGGGVADERNWAISNINNGTFGILPYSDADGAGSAILAANRVGNTVDVITMVATGTIDLSAPVVTATEVTATTFNDVPLDATGVATNYLDETGAYSVPAGGSATPAGSDEEIQWNDSGSFGADGSLVWNGTRMLIGDDGVGGFVLDLRDGNTTGSGATVTMAFTDQLGTIQGSLGTFPFVNLFHLSGEASVQISAQGGEQTISMSGFTRMRTATAAEFDDITDPINTDIGKQQGCQCYDLTNDVPVWSTGTGAGDVWVNGVGTTVRTPV